MELILTTLPFFFVEEHQILKALFDEGLGLLHLRKPNTEPVYSERLINLLPASYRKNIVVHDHFYLKSEYGLRGIHLNQRNPEAPHGYKGQISRSCHSADEVKACKKAFDYVFLSPIFDSVSKDGYRSAFTDDDLRLLSKQRVIDKHVMALGGVGLENIRKLKDYGFGGAVVLGALWQRFDVHRTTDFKELINYFRQLRKAVN